jgi:hypothetical protein
MKYRDLTKSRNYSEAYDQYVAQVIPQIDAEIAEKSHFWMEANARRLKVDSIL